MFCAKLFGNMGQTIHNITTELNEDLAEKLQWMVPDYGTHQILRQSVDARARKSDPKMVYSVEVYGKQETPPKREFPLQKLNYSGPPLLIVGSGPAGLFAALRAVEQGIPCHIFERGSEAATRIKGINRFWRYGVLNPNDNVCFGEGGAGLYSDGKLITRIKSPYIPYVLNRLVEFGAPEEIEYLANPHVGSDRLRRVIIPLRKKIEALGGKFHFNTKIIDLITEGGEIAGIVTETEEEFNSPHVLLATGHSANDIFSMLDRVGVFMEAKDFAVGLRVEHPQELINKIQYKAAWDHPKLGSANYKLAYTDKDTNVGVYSFCMCPGGYVLSSGTEADGIVCNGMSNYHRNSAYANSAIVVTVGKSVFGDSELWAGMKFRDGLERSAFDAVQNAGGSKQLPAQKLNDFLAGQITKSEIKTNSPSGAVNVSVDKLFPAEIRNALSEGFQKFDRKMKGFICDEATVFGVESRTSCPVRITRDADTLESVSHKGLYPVGEGAGYAGGITSAACDGIKVVEKIIELHIQKQKEEPLHV